MADAAADWREAFALGKALPPDADLLSNLGVAASHLADAEAVGRTYGGLLALARDGGSVTNAVWALSRLPSAQVATGDWSAAAASANEVLVLARGIGQAPLTVMPLAWLALLPAFRGEPAGPESLAELEAMHAGGALGIVGVAAADMTEWAKGVRASNAADIDGALHHLQRVRHPTQLTYGEFLRRHRRRVDARPQLRAALEVFTELRAEPWAERARQELRVSGETTGRRDVTTSGTLTPQERQTALLVRSGLGNREIAARLFLSPRTVEYHLSNAYQKLGVRSRGELAQLSLS